MTPRLLVRPTKELGICECCLSITTKRTFTKVHFLKPESKMCIISGSTLATKGASEMPAWWEQTHNSRKPFRIHWSVKHCANFSGWNLWQINGLVFCLLPQWTELLTCSGGASAASFYSADPMAQHFGWPVILLLLFRFFFVMFPTVAADSSSHCSGQLLCNCPPEETTHLKWFNDTSWIWSPTDKHEAMLLFHIWHYTLILIIENRHWKNVFIDWKKNHVG